MTLPKKAESSVRVGTGISSPLRVFCEGSPGRASDLDLRFRVAIITPILP